MKRFSELTLTEKVIELVRWICVPVVAVVSVVVLGQLAAVVIPRPLAQLPGAPVTQPSDLQRFILHRVFAVLMGLAFVIGGAMMAPRSRTTAAVVLAGAWILYSFLIHVALHLEGGKPHLIDFAFAAAASAGGAYITYAGRAQGGSPFRQ